MRQPRRFTNILLRASGIDEHLAQIRENFAHLNGHHNSDTDPRIDRTRRTSNVRGGAATIEIRRAPNSEPRMLHALLPLFQTRVGIGKSYSRFGRDYTGGDRYHPSMQQCSEE